MTLQRLQNQTVDTLYGLLKRRIGVVGLQGLHFVFDICLQPGMKLLSILLEVAHGTSKLRWKTGEAMGGRPRRRKVVIWFR
jgi:hypothetical protein